MTKKWATLIVLAFAQFVMVLDSTVMNVSITQVVSDLHTSVNAMQAAIAFYTLTMASLILIGAKLCDKWGLLRAFMIGSVIYGTGSLITSLSNSITMLFIGWSIIEGLGAVLVIPSIAALVAVNYQKKDRATAYAVIGGVSGAAAAAGPLIGGFMTTYLSWRYVFVAEVFIMLGVIFFARKFKAEAPNKSIKIDIPSAVLSATGMLTLVFGMLQSKTWGWIMPINKPELFGHEVAPFGISLVAYLLLLGTLILKLFFDRQRKLEAEKRHPLLQVSMFSIARLRAGLGVLSAQYLITAAVFFVVPIYLQTVLGLDALHTGIRILPLSFALIIFSGLGSKMAENYTPKQIVRSGQLLLVAGTLLLLAFVEPELSSFGFGLAMFAVGAGLGLLASQLGNINVSSVPARQSSEIGGLQGAFQNLGSSLGTALIGSVMVASLTSGFISGVNASSIPPEGKAYISENVKSAEIVPADMVDEYAKSKGASPENAQEIADSYATAQINSLKESMFFLFVLSVAMLALSRNIPSKL